MKQFSVFVIMLFIAADVFCQNAETSNVRHQLLGNGISLGSIVAAIASWERNKSILWVIIHGIFSWFYVIYFVITRKKSQRRRF